MSPFKSIVLTFSLLPALIAGAIICPRDNNLVTPLDAGASYKIECGVDHVGGDLPGMPLWLPSTDECVAACTANNECVATVYIPPSSGNAPCYLKSSLSLGQPNLSHVSAVKINTEHTCPNINGKQFSVVSRDTNYQAFCYWSFVDADPNHNYAVITPDFPSCLKVCEQNAETAEKCRYVTFTPGKGINNEDIPSPGGKCALHAKVVSSSPNLSVIGGVRYSMCPDQNGNNIRIDFLVFKIQCYRDRVGGNLEGVESIWTAGSRECVTRCSTMPGCKGISWHWGYPKGRCYFKGDVSMLTTPNDQVYGITLVGPFTNAGGGADPTPDIP